MQKMLARRLVRLTAPLARSQQSLTPASRQSLNAARPFSSCTIRKAASQAEHHDDHGGHDSHFDPPGGWLWGIKPGEKVEREGWEIPFYIMCAAYVIATIAYTMKEDTSIQTWALEEARRRLEQEGILEDNESQK